MSVNRESVMTIQLRLALTFLLVLPQAAQSQSTMEWGLGAGTAGLGGGLGARLNQKKAGSKPAGAASAGAARPALPSEADVANYQSSGSRFEANRKWPEAEQSFRSALKAVALREGPGSFKSVPVLQHLVTATREQGKFGDAISFQKTVVAFARRSGPAILQKEQENLAKLYADSGNYAQAEPLMKSAYEVCNARTDASRDERLEIMRSYADILRKLHKDAEANQLEAEIAKASAPALPSEPATP